MTRLLPLALLLAACGPRYDGINIELHSEPPVPVHVSDNDFELPAGIAVVIDVKPLSSNQFDYYESDQLDLRSDNRQVLRVEPTENSRRFVLIGVALGLMFIIATGLGKQLVFHGILPAIEPKK